MSMQSVPIVPITKGLEKDKEPFLLDGDAFPVLYDAFIYQGKINKRLGNRHLARLVEAAIDQPLGNTGATPFALNLFTTLPGIGTLGIDPNSVSITIAAPVGPLTYTDDGNGNLSAPGPFTGTIDYVNGDISINHPAGAASLVTITLNYYTGRPVMGLFVKESIDINSEEQIAFDTVKANKLSRATEQFEDISFDTAGNVIQWSSSDSEFFYCVNYYRDSSFNGLFWATNNKQNSLSGIIVQDGIQIYNGTGWELQTPILNTAGTRFLNGCKILVPYKDRMIALNTLESTAAVGALANRYPNRARWCQNGVPYTNTLGGADATAWQDDAVGKGGWIDAPTNEAIVACGFYKDILVVFFERSTWQLVYNSNISLPFFWQRINSSFGCESTNSTVEFDKGIFAVADKAIVLSDSVNVERIDNKIPLEVFNFHNGSNGPSRVYGIRDFFFETVYWAFPNKDENGTYPNRVLVLNYKEGTYSIYNDSFTCFGYFQSILDRTWAQSTFAWNATAYTWSSGRFQSDFPAICAGNQVGFVCVIDDQTQNDESLYITNPLAGVGITQEAQCIVTAPNHNLAVGRYVTISDVQGMTEINGLVGKIVEIIGTNSFRLDIDTTAMTPYTIGGLITVHNNIEIITKRFNPFFTQGKKSRINFMDFFTDRTNNGEFTLELYIDETRTLPVDSAIITTTKDYGPNITADKVWHRAYVKADSQFQQFKIYLSDAQMRDENIRNSQITIHAINVWTKPTGNLMGYDYL